MMYFGSTYATFFFSSLTVATHSCCACPDATNTHMQIDHVQKVSVATNAHVQTDLVGAAQKVMIECPADSCVMAMQESEQQVCKCECVAETTFAQTDKPLVAAHMWDRRTSLCTWPR